MSEFLYAVGDIVKIVDDIEDYATMEYSNRIEWYDLRKDVVYDMVKYAGETAVINSRSHKNYIGYRLNLDNGCFSWHQDLLRPVNKRASVEEML